jgi:hypothetical protein
MECPKTHIYYPNIVKISYVLLGLGEYINVRRRQKKRRWMLKLFLATSQKRRMTIRKTEVLRPKRGSKYHGIWKALILNT